MRRPEKVINLADEGAYRDFSSVLTAMNCDESAIANAWKAVTENARGSFNTSTNELTDPEFAYSVQAMTRESNAESPPRREHPPLNPGDIAVDFERKRLSPTKVSLWFRQGRETDCG